MFFFRINTNRSDRVLCDLLDTYEHLARSIFD